MAVRIQFRRDTAANWTSINPLIAEGEMGLETDTGLFKIGNGVDVWIDLPYSSGPAGLDGVAAATAPLTYDSGTHTVGIDQSGFDHIANLNYAQFDTTPTGVPNVAGVLSWNAVDETLELQLNAVTLQIGQEQVIKVQKSDNTGLTEGKVVYITGSNGANNLVDYAIASGDSTSAQTFGVMTESVAGGAKAFATTFGLVRAIDTSSLTEGAVVYLSGTVAGGMTSIKPSAPTHLVQIGYCVRSHATEGVLFVKIQNGYETTELHDWADIAPTDGQVPVWNATNTRYEPGTVSSTPTISTVTKTTASLANGASEAGTITIAQGYRLLKVETDKAARIRLYTTTTGRDNATEIVRGWGIDPADSVGCMWDFKTASVLLTSDVNPQVDGYVASGTAIPIRIENVSGSTGTVTLTLTYVKTI